MDDTLAVLEEIAAVGPELRHFLLTSNMERLPSPLPATKRKTPKAFITCFTKCQHTLEVLQLNDPTFGLAGFPSMTALRHLHVTQYDADSIPVQWISEQPLETLSIFFFRQNSLLDPIQQAAFFSKLKELGLEQPAFRVRFCDDWTLPLSLKYAWEYRLPDPILHTSAIPGLYE